ncbi:hypothetical protein ABTY98_40175 [Streptomyces sp. NPDC096040]|uniref:bile acid:sodium symporter family protein n=1 Tax=Streptomyces sp. NPDC096040 TaxID=3155541 RepID=UPI00332DB8BE
MDTLHLVLNAVTVIFIVATMFAAGLGATVPALRGVFTNVPLLLLALLANMVIIPLLGWGIGTLLGLPPASLVALVLVASSPGGPFGAKLAMVQNGDVVAGAAMQVLLASIGSLTFAPTVNGILTAADIGTNVSLDVGALVRTVALLQLVPFAIGLLMRRYATPTARSWHPTAAAVSNITFLIVLAGMLLGNWRAVVDLFGSLSLLAGFLLAAAASASVPCWPQDRRCAAPPWAASPRYATRVPRWPRSGSRSTTRPPCWGRWQRSCSAGWPRPCRSPCSSAAGARPRYRLAPAKARRRPARALELRGGVRLMSGPTAAGG